MRFPVKLPQFWISFACKKYLLIGLFFMFTLIRAGVAVQGPLVIYISLPSHFKSRLTWQKIQATNTSWSLKIGGKRLPFSHSSQLSISLCSVLEETLKQKEGKSHILSRVFIIRLLLATWETGSKGRQWIFLLPSFSGFHFCTVLQPLKAFLH